MNSNQLSLSLSLTLSFSLSLSLSLSLSFFPSLSLSPSLFLFPSLLFSFFFLLPFFQPIFSTSFCLSFNFFHFFSQLRETEEEIERTHAEVFSERQYQVLQRNSDCTYHRFHSAVFRCLESYFIALDRIVKCCAVLY